MLIDTHAHLMFPEFKGTLQDVLSRAKNAGVGKIINIGCTLKDSAEAVKMLDESEVLYATLGLHPYEAVDANEKLMNEWLGIFHANKKVVAVGECGLDYFKAKIPHDVQKKAFRLQIDLAIRANVSLIVHCRDAYDDCMAILEEFPALKKVVFHCYSGTLDFAEKLWEKGFLTSFTGIITYPKSDDLREVVRQCPNDLFMVETDCPFLAPQKFRGQTNEPSYVLEIAKKIAEIKGVSLEEVEELSTKNALRFFGL